MKGLKLMWLGLWLESCRAACSVVSMTIAVALGVKGKESATCNELTTERLSVPLGVFIDACDADGEP